MSKVLITGYKTYNFQNQQNELISGAKISYLSEMKSSKQNELGYLPIQASVNLECISNLKEVPGVYEIKFDMVPGKNNKPELVITGFDFVKSVDINNIFQGKI